VAAIGVVGVDRVVLRAPLRLGTGRAHLRHQPTRLGIEGGGHEVGLALLDEAAVVVVAVVDIDDGPGQGALAELEHLVPGDVGVTGDHLPHELGCQPRRRAATGGNRGGSRRGGGGRGRRGLFLGRRRGPQRQHHDRGGRGEPEGGDRQEA